MKVGAFQLAHPVDLWYKLNIQNCGIISNIRQYGKGTFWPVTFLPSILNLRPVFKLFLLAFPVYAPMVSLNLCAAGAMLTVAFSAQRSLSSQSPRSTRSLYDLLFVRAARFKFPALKHSTQITMSQTIIMHKCVACFDSELYVYYQRKVK